ncbi:hypothetical protein C8N26_1030 [Tenacibaculum lutimaris]|uniref:Uncharacterized protein n=1 Tax=Tenacibaculum lutimaris TaxID=285258 RepID=A0A420E382_9FLAO|nr:hypothetical protein C8N26_1030 [Tenacibaculum lutimaris]
MEFKRRFGNRKKGNPKRGLFLVILLIIVLYLFFNAENILSRFL